MIKQIASKLMKKGGEGTLKNGIGSIGLGTGMNIAMSSYATVSTFNQERKAGSGVGTAIAKGVVDGFMADIIGLGPYMGLTALRTLPSMGVKGYEAMARKGRDISRTNGAPFSANTFMESEQTYTMRQAGMNMISGSSMSAKKAMLGNEAQMFHR